MDVVRAAIGLGAVFIHLRAELNFHRLFNETIEAFDRSIRINETIQKQLMKELGK